MSQIHDLDKTSESEESTPSRDDAIGHQHTLIAIALRESHTTSPVSVVRKIHVVIAGRDVVIQDISSGELH